MICVNAHLFSGIIITWCFLDAVTVLLKIWGEKSKSHVRLSLSWLRESKGCALYSTSPILLDCTVVCMKPYIPSAFAPHCRSQSPVLSPCCNSLIFENVYEGDHCQRCGGAFPGTRAYCHIQQSALLCSREEVLLQDGSWKIHPQRCEVGYDTYLSVGAFTEIHPYFFLD